MSASTPVPVMQPFRLSAPLPDGLVALEASAGTGKTHALSALAVRAVAEGRASAGQLCIVTFTDAATAELRGRVRQGLVTAAAAVRRVQRSGVLGASDDELVRALVDGVGDDELGRRLRRLETAVTDFDLATIATIHGFCHRVLAADPGMAGASVVSGDRDVAEAVNDVVLAHHDDPVQVPSHRLEQTVRAMLATPDAELFLGQPPTAGRASQRAAIDAAAARAVEAYRLVTERRRRSRRLTFDGMITQTRDLVRGPSGPEVVAGLRDRFRFVLLDEFQDTDRVQWDIFRTAFVDPVATTGASGQPPAVVIVGDPKQSIYRFRSAELHAYLDAVAAAGTDVATLDTNWRSDAPVLAALERLLADTEFGDPNVRFRPVRAAPHLAHARLTGDGAAPFGLRWVVPGADGTLTSPEARRAVRADVVQVVHDLLHGPAVLDDPDAPGGRRPVRARDVAILTRSNADALAIAAALGAAGTPAATSSSLSVLDSDAAAQWRVLLRALERPGSPGAVRAAAVGWFLGRAPSELAAMDDDRLAALHDEIRTWAAELRRGGVPALLARARAAGMHTRVLAGPRGERDLTDVDHVAELLQTMTDGRVEGPSTLLDALTRAADDAGEDVTAAERLARRIDRDDDAVQVLTMHKAKGLQFPIVLCPYLWTGGGGGGVRHAHVDGRHLLDAVWTADVGSKAKALCVVADAARAEEAGEASRLLYVALTRAQHRCIVWFAPVTSRSPRSALSQVLARAVAPADLDLAALEAFAARSEGTIDVHPVPAPSQQRAAPLPASSGAADGHGAPDRAGGDRSGSSTSEVAVARRRLDRSWRIWSFTSVSAAAGARRLDGASAAVDGPIERVDTVVGRGEDEVDDAGSAVGGPDSAPERHDDDRVPLRTAPAGTEFGTLVHELLERVDFTAHDLADVLVQESAAALALRSLPVTPEHLARGLLAAIESPLGGPLGSTRLRDVAPSDRLDELEFHLPLGRLRAESIGRVLVEHLADHDPLRPWAEGLATRGFDVELAGALTGSIDLVFRTGNAHDRRYWVADYKSNRIGRGDAADLAAAMAHHDYPLQAILYLVALHRTLRARLPGERVATSIGGVAYLFLRAMDPTRPPDDVTGVWWWRPSAAAIEALDRLLAEGAP